MDETMVEVPIKRGMIDADELAVVVTDAGDDEPVAAELELGGVEVVRG